MLIWIYRLLFAPFMLLSLPRYLLHIRKRGGYRDRFATRFGMGLNLPEKAPGKRRIWVQAVSLGEMLAIEPLVRRLAEDERVELFLTTTTSTGYAMGREKYGEIAVEIAYFPVDFWPFSRRVWRLAKPDLAICAETELWPEHIAQAKRAGVPFALVNARLSDRSFGRFQRVAWLVRPLFRSIARICAGSEHDRERFVALGADPQSVVTTGNLKVDVPMGTPLSPEQRVELRRQLGVGEGFVLLGSSTWPGEESMLVQALALLRKSDIGARLIIVPRHAERRAEIESELAAEASGFRYHFKSRGLPSEPVDILVADTHGELRTLTQLADLAFVGKSLPPHREGQTPVECGALGVPMVLGPGMSNFRSISAGLLEAGAAIQVRDAEEALRQIEALHANASARARLGEAGRRWHAANRGAVDRTAREIEAWL